MSSEMNVTEKAISEIQKIKKENNIPEENALRIGVQTGGCSGLSYSLGFDSEVAEDDVVFEFTGLKVYADSESMKLLKGAELDYASDENGEGFVFNNPNAQSHCGSGCHCH